MTGNGSAAPANALTGRPTMFDVGIGVLYFFTSHMVIRALYYVGLDRTPWQLAVFIMLVILAIVVAHGFAGALQKSRLAVETRFGVPAVSVVAAVGAVVALISTLPVVGVGMFYLSAILLGLACGWIVVIWSSTIHVTRPDANSFYLDPALLVAVAVYFLFRCVSSLSEAVAQGFLLALPLVALACIVRSGKLLAERAQSLEVLVVVAAAFAIGCSLVVYFSGRESELLPSGLNFMVLFEVLAVAVMVFCCALMRGFAQRSDGLPAPVIAAVTIGLCYGAPFAVGLLMGSAGIPAHSPDALWESNIWVLVIAIFAYDIRDSLYAVRGLAVGLMFEAMCVAQLIARVATLELTISSVLVAVALSALYLLCVGNQLLRDSFWRDGRGARVMPRLNVTAGEKEAVAAGRKGLADDGAAGDVRAAAEASRKSAGELQRAVSGQVEAAPGAVAAAVAASVVCPGGSRAPVPDPMAADADPADEGEALEEGVPVEIAAYCQDLADEYGLTPREAEILALVALGRSAKYIADELQVSYNTTRTHIRHIYEKLNIHSKQELSDVVLFGSGVM